MRGLGAAVVERVGGLRGLGAAVVEGSGRGSGSVAVGECLLRLRGVGGEREDVERGEYGLGRLNYDCSPPICDTRCRGKQSTCECTCCLKKRSASVPSQSTSADSVQHVIVEENHSFAYTYTDENSTSSRLIPIIIVPVALIILVICVMVYFRVRPFHRVRYLLRS
ncbi:hypothetical protein, conserved [Babesia bigemina]|uniref:Uncharacterized protein n=1 Tax=Babesia bigemina TaxID=5866 RepID=A0A061BM05_BABBI|nr:hypothetical protein, conserved [Babesia bigemina]CDR71906.1 hypothetical protein, conserved [Babesia bigemina]|eukprot:XP_012770848.1 hypothetical protein, conserved [Babesia bigemina]